MRFEEFTYIEDFVHGNHVRVHFEDVHADFELQKSKRFGMSEEPAEYVEEYTFAKICQLLFTPGLDELDAPYVESND